MVAQLKITLMGTVPEAHETDPAAYALFLQARHLSNLLTPAGWEQSNELYQQALAIAPNYADAWAGMARNYTNMSTFNLLPQKEGNQLAREASDKALATDPENVQAIRNLSYLAAAQDHDFVTAAKLLTRALSLEPTNTNTIGSASGMARNLGRLDEAIMLGEYQVARDPVNPIGLLNLAAYYVMADRLDEAIATAQTAAALSPGTAGAHYWTGEALLRKREWEAALTAFSQEADDEWRVKGTALALYELGRQAEFEESFAELRERWGDRWPIEVAHVYAWIGETDSVFPLLEKETEVNGLAGVMIDPYFTHLHDDPRWQPILEKAGVSDAQLDAIEFKVVLP